MSGFHRMGQVRRHGNGLRAGLRRAHVIRLFGVATVVAGLTAIATAGAAQASQHGKAAGSTWKIEKTPNPAGADISGLSAVSCTSGRACTAVGSDSATTSSPSLPLAERWNGTSWRIQPTANPTGAASSNFFGVSCASATACTAVGTAFHTAGSRNVNLAETWNGKTWRVQATPNPRGSTNGQLFAVSCTSPSACTAVGNGNNAAGRTLAVAERWNGKTWRIQAVSQAAKTTWFTGVSCSTARACTAVGYQNDGTGDAQPLAETWNGAKWQVQAVPLPHADPGGAFSAVSCTAPGACTATGTDFGIRHPALAERWNGKTWRVQTTPNPPSYQQSAAEITLDGVSCTSATACTASGEYAPGGLAAYFVEAWNGSSWRLETTPVPAGFAHGALLGMSCAVARCTAVGAWSGGARLQETLAMAN